MKKISFVIFAVFISFSRGTSVAVPVQEVLRSCLLLDSEITKGFEIDNFCFILRCTNGLLSFVRINPMCNSCTLVDDPHIVTFDQTAYDFHGRCNYSISQPFSCDRPKNESYAPKYGIYGDFQDCLGGSIPPSCLRYTTYKIDPHTALNITHDKALDQVDIKINNNPITVSTLPSAPPIPGTLLFYPVILWKEGNCVRIAAADFSIYACVYQMFIYTHNSHLDQLFGLCGKYTNDGMDDFTSRDCTLEPIDIFGKSWATAEQNPEDGRVCANNVQIDCDGEQYRKYCTEKVETVRCNVDCGRPSSFRIEIAIKNCMSDCCAQPNLCDFWVKVAVKSTCDLGIENALQLFGVELPPICTVATRLLEELLNI